MSKSLIMTVITLNSGTHGWTKDDREKNVVPFYVSENFWAGFEMKATTKMGMLFALEPIQLCVTSLKCSVEFVPTCTNSYLESGCVNVFA